MEESFKVRSYGFGELAQLYFPNISKKSASAQLRKWIVLYKKMETELFKAGYKHPQRILTPMQVSIIARLIGEP